MLIDTHAHLDYKEFEADFQDVLNRADAAGVKRIITIGTSIESSRRAVALAEKYPNIYAVIGVHPTTALEAEEDISTPLRELAKSPRVVAVGETGLDYHQMAKPMPFDPELKSMFGGDDQAHLEATIQDGALKSAQASVFEQQLDLAAELGLNVVIHQRDAWQDTLEILRPYSDKVRAVFHCFGNSFEQAEEVFAMGHLVSFTGIVTFKNAPMVRECATRSPADRFMVETDCPYLAPVPFRGKRCEPAHTALVAECIATLRGETATEVARQTTENAVRFFRF